VRIILRFFAGLVGLCAAVQAQEHAFQSIFRPLATPARAEYELSLLVLSICAAIFAVVTGLIVYVVVRFRDRGPITHAEPPQVYGSNQVEIAWTVIPILIVFVLTLATARVTSAIQDREPTASSLQVNVIGHQWWWEFRYPDSKVVTANELHVPVGRMTFLNLQSADVVHSFWIPQMSGKTDVIPGRKNRMWIDPREAGVFLGNCAEYCGAQHAHMLIRLVVDTPEEFDRWTAAQRRSASMINSAGTNSAGTNSAGENAFLNGQCVDCHTVRGLPASGDAGPDLTHLMSRATFASGMLPITAENLKRWLKDPQAVKSGTKMIIDPLSDKDVDAMVEYLMTLK
jgi:cytochrome c oxidase subunit 2